MVGALNKGCNMHLLSPRIKCISYFSCLVLAIIVASVTSNSLAQDDILTWQVDINQRIPHYYHPDDRLNITVLSIEAKKPITISKYTIYVEEDIGDKQILHIPWNPLQGLFSSGNSPIPPLYIKPIVPPKQIVTDNSSFDQNLSIDISKFFDDSKKTEGHYFLIINATGKDGNLNEAHIIEFDVKKMGKIPAIKKLRHENKTETPLPGWKITASGKDQNLKEVTQTKTTDSSGRVVFDVDPGVWTLEEETKGFYKIANGSQKMIKDIRIAPGATHGEVTFINELPVATLRVIKFEDLNENKEKDPGEAALGNWVFYVEYQDKNGKRIRLSSTTNESGVAIFKLNPEDETNYVITEDVKPDWICTTDNPISIKLVPGQTQPVYFGNKKIPGKIRIHKFRDLNKNGVMDKGESYVSWPFRIGDIKIETSSSGPAEMTLPPGRYTIDEVINQNLPCWKATTSTSVPIEVKSGVAEDKWFGNVLEQEIRILKFNDSNRNRIRDAGEEGLSDWIFTVKDKNTGETKTIGPTNKDGVVVFKSSPDTTYEITEFIKSGWMSTTPRQRTMVMNSEQCFKEAEFGNAIMPVPDLGSINITKYYDKNQSKSWDKGEILLEGWEFEIANLATGVTNNVTTQVNGSIILRNLPVGDYQISETPMKCWKSTSPSIVNVSVKKNIVTPVFFGNIPVDCIDCCQKDKFEKPSETDDIEVNKIVEPNVLDQNKINLLDGTPINYTIEIKAKRKSAPTDLAISINTIVSENGELAASAIGGGVSQFLKDENKKAATLKPKIGLLTVDALNESRDIQIRSARDDYKDIINVPTSLNYRPTQEASPFAMTTYNGTEFYFKESPRGTEKILVLISDANSSIDKPLASLSKEYTVYAILVGKNGKLETKALLDSLTKANNGTTIEVTDSQGINAALKKLTNVMIPASLKDINLVDTLPSFMDEVKFTENRPDKTTNSGNKWKTNSFYWHIDNLSSGETWRTTFTARFCWRLPADVNLTSQIPSSEVSYTREDGYHGIVAVPEKTIQIGLDNPCIEKETVYQSEPKRSTEPKTEPGFEIIPSIGGLMAALFLLRKR